MLGIAPLGATPLGAFRTITAAAGPNAYTLTVAAGSYTISGSAQSLRYGRRLNLYTELITNGYFDTDTSGWTVRSIPSGATFAASGGFGTLTIPPSTSCNVYQGFATVVGRTYRLIAKFGTSLNTTPAVLIGTTSGGAEITSAICADNSTTTLDFVASTATTYVSFVPFNVVFTHTPPTKAISFDLVSVQDTGSYVISGAAVGLRFGRRMSMAPGSYSLSGAAVALLASHYLSAVPGVYSITGTAVGLRFGHRLTIAPGSYSITGAAVSLRYGRMIRAVSGIYAITGAATQLLAGRRLVVGSGAYSQTGASVSLRFGHRINAVPGIYELDGKSAIFDYHEVTKISADPGVYTMTGSGVTFIYNHRLAVTPGTYLIQGHAPSITAARLLGIGSGSYSITGAAMTMSQGGLTLGANSGVYHLTGSNVIMVVARKLALAGGTYTIAGSAAQLLAARRLVIGSGVYTIVDTPPSTPIGRRLNVGSGVYVLTGQSATFHHSYHINLTPGVYSISGSPINLIGARRMDIGSHAFQIVWAPAQVNYHRAPPGPRSVAVDPAPIRYVSVDPLPRRVAVDPLDRRLVVDPDERYAGVEPLEHVT